MAVKETTNSEIQRKIAPYVFIIWYNCIIKFNKHVIISPNLKHYITINLIKIVDSRVWAQTVILHTFQPNAPTIFNYWLLWIKHEKLIIFYYFHSCILFPVVKRIVSGEKNFRVNYIHFSSKCFVFLFHIWIQRKKLIPGYYFHNLNRFRAV